MLLAEPPFPALVEKETVMEFEPMSKETADEIAEEFFIRGDYREGFSAFIVDLEFELKFAGFEFPSVGKETYEASMAAQNKALEVRCTLLDVIRDPQRQADLGVDMDSVLPTKQDGSIDLPSVFEYASLAVPEKVSDDVRLSDIEVLVITCHTLDRLAREHRTPIVFSSEASPRTRPRGRPINENRAALVRTYLDRYHTFMTGVLQYTEQSDCVRLCELLLDFYGIETGDTASIVRRALERTRAP